MEMSVRPGRKIVIGAQGMEAIMQNIATIVTTLVYSVAFDRGFATSGAFIDSPAPRAVGAKMAELAEAIERREPRVKVLRIAFDADVAGCAGGRLYPRIVFALREGVTP